MPGLARVEALMHGVVGVLPSTLPTYVGHGTGVGGVDPAVNLNPAAPAGIVAGDWLILPVCVRAASAPICATPAGWDPWYDDQSSISSFARQFVFAREYDGSFAMPTVDWGATGVTPAARARIHAIRGTSGVREGAATATANASTAIAIPAVTTLGLNRLVIAVESFTAATAVGADPAGTTGGTYVHRTNTTTGSGNANVCLLTAEMAAAGTIANGVSTIASSNWVCRAFALLPI